MEPKKIIINEDELEKELKTLVSKMKNEHTALNKLLNKLNANEIETRGKKVNEKESNPKKK